MRSARALSGGIILNSLAIRTRYLKAQEQDREMGVRAGRRYRSILGASRDVNLFYKLLAEQQSQSTLPNLGIYPPFQIDGTWCYAGMAEMLPSLMQPFWYLTPSPMSSGQFQASNVTLKLKRWRIKTLR